MLKNWKNSTTERAVNQVGQAAITGVFLRESRVQIKYNFFRTRNREWMQKDCFLEGRYIDIVLPPGAGRNGRLIFNSAQNRKFLYGKGHNYMP